MVTGPWRGFHLINIKWFNFVFFKVFLFKKSTKTSPTIDRKLTPLNYARRPKVYWEINSQGILVKELTSNAEITIYNQLGQEIETIQTDGVGFFKWQKPLSYGNYYITLKSTDFTAYKKINIR